LSISRSVAGVAVATALIAGVAHAQTAPSTAVQTPAATVQPVNAPATAIPVAPLPLAKRIVVNAGKGDADGSLFDHLTLPTGKSQIVNLPGDAQEVLVGDPQVADVAISSPRRISIVGRKAGETNVFVLGASGSEIARLEISVGPDAAVVQAALQRALPGTPVTVTTEGSSLMLTGTLQSDGEIGRVVTVAKQFVDNPDKIVNLLKVARQQQVLIQVRVAEVQRTALKEIGSQISVNQTTPSQFGVIRGAGTTSMLGLNPLNQFAATFTLQGIKDLYTTLSLLEQRGLVRNLAEPNLVAVSGETAMMLAGGEVPIPVPDRDGIKIEYKPFGVSLSFVPVILDNGTISLRLATEVSSLSNDRVDVPLFTGKASINAFIVRRASSTVEMPSGGSLMIAGLIQNDVLSGINGVPGLMDLPILGQLFRSNSFKRNETELVIIVTASLVRSTAPQAMVASTDTISPASDTDSWVYGRLTRQFTPGFTQDMPGKAPPTAFGFSMDEDKP
jgi:pilus assembly protein CpaC